MFCAWTIHASQNRDRLLRCAWLAGAGLTWGGEGEAGSRGWQLAVLLGGSVARVRTFARETTSSLLSASALLPPADACGVQRGSCLASL